MLRCLMPLTNLKNRCMGHDRGGEEAASALSCAFIELKSCNAALLDALTNLEKRSFDNTLQTISIKVCIFQLMMLIVAPVRGVH
ncbi:hypothetical protein Tco_0240525 [Tanacetum coccineum]